MKKFLVAAFAAVSFASMNAYYIEFKNITKGKQATDVRIDVFEGGFPYKRVSLSSGSNVKIENPPKKKPYKVTILMLGKSGFGKDKRDNFHVLYKKHAGKDLTFKITFEDDELKLILDTKV